MGFGKSKLIQLQCNDSKKIGSMIWTEVIVKLGITRIYNNETDSQRKQAGPFSNCIALREEENFETIK